jgi:outer membrane protein W
MKKIILTAMVVFAFGFANAQEEGKFRVGLDLGYAMPKGGGGILYALEAKYNLKDNMNVGLRWGGAAMAKSISDNLDAEVSTNGVIAGTFDYYFHKSGSSFAPFVGAGVGYYTLGNIGLSAVGNDLNLDASSKFGGLVRGGFELGKFRMGLEYNLIPKSTATTVNVLNLTAGERKIANSYLGISLGFYVGGGKWSK